MDNNSNINIKSLKLTIEETNDEKDKNELISPSKENKESNKSQSSKKSKYFIYKEMFHYNSTFTPNIDHNYFQQGRFSANKTFTDSPMENHRKFIQNFNQNHIFSSNYKFENSYSKEFNTINPHLYLNNKDGNICINIFDSKFRDKNFLLESAGKSNLIKKINFDIGENK